MGRCPLIYRILLAPNFLCAGELNEKQKMELEQKRSLVVRQEYELNRLREKLSEMSRFADQKDADFKITSEELR